MKGKPKNIDDYLAGLSDADRAALGKLREAIHSAAAGLEECISYSLPAFRLKGKVVAGFGSNKNCLAYYPFSGTILPTFADSLKNYETTKGAIRFQADKPLSAVLVRKLVKARIAEDRKPR